MDRHNRFLCVFLSVFEDCYQYLHFTSSFLKLNCPNSFKPLFSPRFYTFLHVLPIFIAPIVSYSEGKLLQYPFGNSESYKSYWGEMSIKWNTQGWGVYWQLWPASATAWPGRFTSGCQSWDTWKYLKWSPGVFSTQTFWIYAAISLLEVLLTSFLNNTRSGKDISRTKEKQLQVLIQFIEELFRRGSA